MGAVQHYGDVLECFCVVFAFGFYGVAVFVYGYGDFAEGAIGLGAGGEHNVLEMIFGWSLAASYRVLTGVDIDRLSPQDMIGSIAPRPVLLIYGSTERSLGGAYERWRCVVGC